MMYRLSSFWLCVMVSLCFINYCCSWVFGCCGVVFCWCLVLVYWWCWVLFVDVDVLLVWCWLVRLMKEMNGELLVVGVGWFGCCVDGSFGVVVVVLLWLLWFCGWCVCIGCGWCLFVFVDW